MSQRLAIFAHFLLHGIHHAFPQDPFRLVFPPALGHLLLLIVFKPFFAFVIPTLIFPSMIAGGIAGYVLYDIIHYFMHHLDLENNSPSSSAPKDHSLIANYNALRLRVRKYWQKVKRYHMRHHFKADKQGFGVSQKFWDIVFETQIPS